MFTFLTLTPFPQRKDLRSADDMKRKKKANVLKEMLKKRAAHVDAAFVQK